MYESKRFDGEVYKHLYERFIVQLEKLGKSGTHTRSELTDLRKRIAKDGL